MKSVDETLRLPALIKTGEEFANKSLCILPPPLPAVDPVFSAAAVPCIPPLPPPVRELPSHHCHSPCIPATVVRPEPHFCALGSAYWYPASVSSYYPSSDLPVQSLFLVSVTEPWFSEGIQRGSATFQGDSVVFRELQIRDTGPQLHIQ